MRLIMIIVLLFIGLHSIERRLNIVNNNLEKIIKLMEQRGEMK